MKRMRQSCLVIFVLLLSIPLENAFHTQSYHTGSRYGAVIVQKSTRKQQVELLSTPTRFNNEQKSTRNFYNEKENRNSPKFRNKYKNTSTTDDKRRQVEKVLLACREGKTTVTITEVNHAITTAGRLYRPDDAVEIFRSINKLGFKADLMSYNNVIWCVGNAGRFEISKQFFQELTARTDLKPNVYTYGALMHACAKIKGYKQALIYLDRMIEQGITPNQIVFTSAMEACAEAGLYKEALGVMDRMAATGIKPDITMVNAAIKACSLAGAMEEAEKLASQLRDDGSMDLFTYHTLMMGHTKLGRHQKVLSLYNEALESSAKLDGGVYSLAMLSALNCGMYQLVPRIAARARSEDVPLTEASYTILIKAYSEAGGNDQAVQCLDQMVHEGLHPNVITYAAAIAACKHRPQMVLSLLERMKNEKVEPNTIVLTAAIDSLAREGGGMHTDKAYEILQDMELNGPEPNIYTYNTVTRAFAQAGRLEEALEVLNSIKKRGLSPDHFTFTTLLMASGRTGNSDKVVDIMAIMKNSGVVADEIVFGAAIDAHRRAGNSVRALECLQDMYRNKLEPTAAHYNLVIRTLKAEGYVEKMFKMVMAISHKEGAKINANTFELCIEAVLEKEQWREALLLIQGMERLSFKPSMQTYVALVELLERARQYRAVLALYRVMVRDGYDFYENTVLNGVFKRLVNVAAKGVDADLQTAALQVASSVSLPPSLSGTIDSVSLIRPNGLPLKQEDVLGDLVALTDSK